MWDKLKSLTTSSKEASGDSINAPAPEVAAAYPEKVSEGAIDEPVFTLLGFGWIQGAPVFLRADIQGNKVINKEVEKINNLFIAQTNFKKMCVKLFPKVFSAGPY